MKYAAAFLVFLFMGVSLYAQENNTKAKFEKKGDLVEATYYHANGEVSQMGYFKNKKPHGIWKAFDASGNKITSATYEEGVKVGKWFFWKDDQLTEVDYENSRPVKVKDYSITETIVLN